MQARASALRREGHSANRIALTKFGFMEILDVAKNATGAKAAHDTLLVFDAQPFFNIVSAIPMSGCNACSNVIVRGIRPRG